MLTTFLFVTNIFFRSAIEKAILQKEKQNLKTKDLKLFNVGSFLEFPKNHSRCVEQMCPKIKFFEAQIFSFDISND